MTISLHHREIRKRIYTNLEPFPHTSRLKKFMDKLVFLVGTMGPVFTLPQIYIIYVNKEATSVSGLSWVFYLLSAVVWLMYGVIHKEKALILTNILWVFVDIVILLEIFIY